MAWGQESWGSISEVKHLKGEGAKWCKESAVMVTALRVKSPETGLILSHIIFLRIWLRVLKHCPADHDRLCLCSDPLLPPHPSWESHVPGASMLWDPHLLQGWVLYRDKSWRLILDLEKSEQNPCYSWSRYGRELLQPCSHPAPHTSFPLLQWHHGCSSVPRHCHRICSISWVGNRAQLSPPPSLRS